MGIDTIFLIVVIIFSAIIHEVMHGVAADWLGDKTARYAGRLTLNPIPHIDMFGSIILPVLLALSHSPFFFGWAKPVPYNPYNLKNQKWGPVMVGLAGPAANLLLAASFAIVLRLFPSSGIAPFLAIIVYANVLLMVFNLVPIPPLDGSKILYAILPDSAAGVKQFLDRYGFVILLFFVFFLFDLIAPVIDAVVRLLVGNM